MSAYNWVAIDGKCPICLQATTIRAQSHVAAAFDGDQQGRFCYQVYKLGDKFRWWSEDSKQYHAWMISGRKAAAGEEFVQECCYATCAAKRDRLYVILEISDLIIKKVTEIGREDQWPQSFPK